MSTFREVLRIVYVLAVVFYLSAAVYGLLMLVDHFAGKLP